MFKINLEIPDRKVRGRMNDIPKEFTDSGIPVDVKRIGYSEEVIDGQVVGTEVFQTIDKLNGVQNPKTAIHFTPSGFVCICGQFMVEEAPRAGKINVWCANMNCSENLVSKTITLPTITDYVISSDPS